MALVVNLDDIKDLSVSIDKEGDFILKIIEVKDGGFDKNGATMIKISYAGFDKTDAEKSMLNYSELHFIAPYGKERMRGLFEAMKADKKVDMELFQNRYVEVSIKIEDKPQPDGTTKRNFNINKYTYCSLNDKLPPLVAPTVDIDDSEIPF